PRTTRIRSPVRIASRRRANRTGHAYLTRERSHFFTHRRRRGHGKTEDARAPGVRNSSRRPILGPPPARAPSMAWDLFIPPGKGPRPREESLDESRKAHASQVRDGARGSSS